MVWLLKITFVVPNRPPSVKALVTVTSTASDSAWGRGGGMDKEAAANDSPFWYHDYIIIIDLQRDSTIGMFLLQSIRMSYHSNDGENMTTHSL